MHKLWINAKSLTQEDIEAWFADNNCEQFKIAPVDWGFFNVEIADDHLAVQFRLAFDASLGIKKTLEEEMIEALSAEIVAEIDKEILGELHRLAEENYAAETTRFKIEVIKTPIPPKL